MNDEKDDLVQQLDRNMDTVYDAVCVLNSAMTAIMRALPTETAAPVARYLDEILDSLPGEENPPEGLALETLRGWRNMAAKTAGLPRRRG